jgi:uncharacterized protein YbjT (DUF2867 family)
MTPVSPTRTLLLAGATGLVGGHALGALLASRRWDRILALGRRAPSVEDPRLEARAVDFAALEGEPPVAAAAALCALGTTLAAAGSPEAFRRVDLDAALAFARFAHRSGAETLGLVSSVGADARARGLYLRVKGELEAAVSALPFRTVVVLRPSLLLGPRGERRPAEAVAQAVFPALSPLLRGAWRRFRAVDAAAVGKALAAAAERTRPGRVILHHDEILAAARP